MPVSLLFVFAISHTLTALFGKKLFIRFTASAFRKLPSIYVFSFFPFGFEGRMWDLIVSVPDHCLSYNIQFSFLIKKMNCKPTDNPVILSVRMYLR